MIGARTLTFTGQVQVVTPSLPAYPIGPIFPPQPIREITMLSNVVGTGDGLSCGARGTAALLVPQQELDTPPTATYNLYPPEPVHPIDPITPDCRDFQVTVRFLTTLDANGLRLVSSAEVTGAA